MEDFKFRSYRKQWQAAARKAADKTLTGIAINICNTAIKLAPVFLGMLRRAVGFEPPADIKGQRTVLIGFREGAGEPVKYAMSVENGRRPGGKMPPPGALDLWVQRKLGVPKEEAAGVAFLVGRKIARDGTKPQPFMRPAYEEHASGSKVFDRYSAEFDRLKNEIPPK